MDPNICKKLRKFWNITEENYYLLPTVYSEWCHEIPPQTGGSGLYRYNYGDNLRRYALACVVGTAETKDSPVILRDFYIIYIKHPGSYHSSWVICRCSDCLRIWYCESASRARFCPECRFDKGWSSQLYDLRKVEIEGLFCGDRYNLPRSWEIYPKDCKK